MNQQTASRLVLFFVLGGIFVGLWTGRGAADKYRKVWGVTALGVAGAALADLAPMLVGPFFLLLIVAYAAGHYGKLGGIVHQVRSTTGVPPAPNAPPRRPSTGGPKK